MSGDFGKNDLALALVIKVGKPQALPRGSQRFTFREIWGASFRESLKVQGKEAPDDKEREPKPLKMVVHNHVVWIPKYRKKKLFASLRPDLGEALHELARQRECRIEEGHLLEKHVHMHISIPPKYAISSVIGFIKGKSAIYIARNFSGYRKNFTDESF